MAYSLISHVEESLGVNGGTSSAIDTTGASFLVVVVSWYSGGTAPTLSDSKSNTWTGLTAQTQIGAMVRMFYCAGATTGSGHTFTASGSGSYCVVSAMAYSGSHATPFDAQNGNTGTTSTTTTGSVTPSEDNELVIAGVCFADNSSGAVSINGGFTKYSVGFAGGVNMGGGIGYLIQTSAAAANPTWNITNSADTAAVIACFKAAAAAAGNRRRRVLFCGRYA